MAALGKVLKFQGGSVDVGMLTPFWLSQMPLTHDLEEAKIQNELLAVSLLKAPQIIIGEGLERLPHLVTILGEICQTKQCEHSTLQKLSVVIANISQDAGVSDKFKTLCEALGEEQKTRISDTYSKCDAEVRANVMHSLEA